MTFLFRKLYIIFRNLFHESSRSLNWQFARTATIGSLEVDIRFKINFEILYNSVSLSQSHYTSQILVDKLLITQSTLTTDSLKYPPVTVSIFFTTRILNLRPRFQSLPSAKELTILLWKSTNHVPLSFKLCFENRLVRSTKRLTLIPPD